MSILTELASANERKDEELNITLAKKIASKNDGAAIKELVLNLLNKNKEIQSDCIKVLYEAGYLKKDLIAPYYEVFMESLSSRNNRLVWGAMTALGCIADVKADQIGKRVNEVMRATENGSVITQDWGIRVLAIISAKTQVQSGKIYAFLVSFLKKCPAKDIPRHAESILIAVNPGNRGAFLRVLKDRHRELKPSQAKRVEKIMKTLPA